LFLTGSTLMKPSSKLGFDIQLCRSNIAQPHIKNQNRFERL
jgi:hypothetical protein